MPLFHITFFLDLAPFREAPYFSAKSYLDPDTITDEQLSNSHYSRNNFNRLASDEFVDILGKSIILQTKTAFEKHTAAKGFTEDEKKTAWKELSRSPAFFGVTSTFALHESIKNSLEAEADCIQLHVCHDENRVTCIVTDNGTGFISKKFHALFSYKDKIHAEPLIDYRTDVLENASRFVSPKKQVGSQVEEKTYYGRGSYSPDRRIPPPRKMQILKAIDERMPAYGISVGGQGHGLAMTLQAMELGGGVVQLTNMERLADISSLTDIRPNIPESDSGSVIIFSSPPMSAATFEALQAIKDRFEGQSELRYFQNLGHDRMEKPCLDRAPFLEHPQAIRVRLMDGSVYPLNCSDLPITSPKMNTHPRAEKLAASKRISMRLRHTSSFFEHGESKQVSEPFISTAGTKPRRPNLSPLILDDDASVEDGSVNLLSKPGSGH